MHTDSTASESTASIASHPEYDYRAANSGFGIEGVEVYPALSFRYRVIKRTMDIVLVLLSLPVLVPVVLIIGAMIKFTSPGPVFFSHRRICRDASFFSMWKFRTMCVNSSSVLEQHLLAHPKAKAEWTLTHKLKCDPRVTPVGLLLRRLSLDELPQIWNVLTGRMSLVGPRPIVAAEMEKYGACFACYCRVKPGLTGLWQVSGRSTLSYEVRVKLDCVYVNEWSILRDIKILFLTFRSVIQQDGAF